MVESEHFKVPESALMKEHEAMMMRNKQRRLGNRYAESVESPNRCR